MAFQSDFINAATEANSGQIHKVLLKATNEDKSKGDVIKTALEAILTSDSNQEKKKYLILAISGQVDEAAFKESLNKIVKDAAKDDKVATVGLIMDAVPASVSKENLAKIEDGKMLLKFKILEGSRQAREEAMRAPSSSPAVKSWGG